MLNYLIFKYSQLENCIKVQHFNKSTCTVPFLYIKMPNNSSEESQVIFVDNIFPNSSFCVSEC